MLTYIFRYFCCKCVANRISFTTFLDIPPRFKGKEKPQKHAVLICSPYGRQWKYPKIYHKKKIVLEYLGGNITSQDLAAKYKIHAPSTVRTWIKQYNNHEDLTNSRKEGVYLMAKNGARKNTTLEERINIVEECINTGCNYASTANKYGCSYGQVYAWVRKYKDKGIEGLYDRRGKNKAISQLSDIEKLKAENRLLKAQTQQQQMEIDFLKKLDEIERR